jgi:glutathione S-transferase
MLQLHYYPGNASMIPHILLEELGVPFELKLVDRTVGAHKTPNYLKLNPNGLIPVLIDGDLVLYETAAICLHLAESHPAAALLPPLHSSQGPAARAHCYKWLIWMTNTLQAALLPYFYPERWVDAGDAAAAAQVKRQAEAMIGGMLDQIDAHLAAHGEPWFLGAQFSVLDAYVLVLCRWTRGFDRPARGLPQVGPYLARVLARPAVQRVFAVEKLAQPFV